MPQMRQPARSEREDVLALLRDPQYQAPQIRASDGSGDAIATGLRLLGDGPVLGGIAEYLAQQAEKAPQTDWAQVGLSALMGAPIAAATFQKLPGVGEHVARMVNPSPDDLDPATWKKLGGVVDRLKASAARRLEALRAGERPPLLVFRGGETPSLNAKDVGTFFHLNPDQLDQYANGRQVEAYLLRDYSPAELPGGDASSALYGLAQAGAPGVPPVDALPEGIAADRYVAGTLLPQRGADTAVYRSGEVQVRDVRPRRKR